MRMTDSWRMMFCAFAADENPSTVSYRRIAAMTTTGSIGRLRNRFSRNWPGAPERAEPD
jgi:hypothetical protein